MPTGCLNTLARSALTLVLLAWPFAGTLLAQAPDLSSDEGVLAELNRLNDAKPQAPDDKPRRKLEAKFICINRFKEAPQLIVIGSFAYDRGCRRSGAFIDSIYYEKDEATLGKRALETLGWKAANRQQREALARRWVEQGLLAFRSVMTVGDGGFKDREFQAPMAVTGKNGEITVTLWIRTSGGRGKEKGYQNLEYRFSRDGDLLGTTTLEALLL